MLTLAAVVFVFLAVSHTPTFPCAHAAHLNNNSMMPSSSSGYHLAYIAREVTAVIELLAEGQRQAVQRSLQSLYHSSNSSSSSIMVDMHVLAARDVQDATILFHLGISHVTYSEEANLDVIGGAPNITFTVSELTATIEEFPNMEVVLPPFEAAAFEAGLLAASITKTKTIALIYAHFYRDSINGVREALEQICPLCSLVALGACSGSYACPGQFDRFLSIAGRADVVIVATHSSNFIPRQIIGFNQNNATALGLPRKYIINIGVPVNDVAADVVGDPWYLGYLRFLVDDTVANLVHGLVFGNFTATVQTVPTVWSRSFLNASKNPDVTDVVLGQFLLSQRLFKWGAYVPTYSAIDKALDDSGRVGGPPIAPIGDIMTGYQQVATWSSSDNTYLLPSIDDTAAVCTLHGRIIMVATDLSYVTVISGRHAHIRRITLPLSAAAYAAAAGQNVSSELSPYYNISLKPLSNPQRRVRMSCSAVPDRTYGTPTTWILTGGRALISAVINGSTTTQEGGAAPGDILRLRLVCLDPYSIWCDFYVLENITSLYSDEQGSVRFWDAAVHVLSPPADAEAESNLSFLLPVDAPATPTEDVWMGVVVRPDLATVHQMIRVLPPAALLGGGQTTFAPQNVSWVEELRGVLAYDPSRRVMVLLPIQDTNHENIGTGGSSGWWWGVDGPAAAPSVLQWVDYSTPLPDRIAADAGSWADASALVGFVYLPVLHRLVAALRPLTEQNAASISRPIADEESDDDGTAHSVLRIYHYSTVLKVWVSQSSLLLQGPSAVHDTQFRAFPLPSIEGGGLLLYPTRPTSTRTHLFLVEYPKTVPVCNGAGGFALNHDGRTCVACPAGELPSSDGFCAGGAALVDNSCVECSWAVPLGSAVGAFLLAVLITISLIYLYRTRWSRKGRLLLLAEMSTQRRYAPPSGTCAILTMTVVDADLLWETGGMNLLSDDEDEDGDGNRGGDSTDETVSTTTNSSSGGDTHQDEQAAQNKPSKKKKKSKHRPVASPQLVTDILDKMHEAMCTSASVNRGYLAAFRGETGIVVHTNPESLLCIALEVSLAMAHHRPQVRMAVGLHIGNVVRTMDAELKRCLFAGQGINIASRISSLSASSTNTTCSGRFMASQQFLDHVRANSPAAMTALSLGIGDQSQIRYEGVVTVVQEITSSILMEALGDQTMMQKSRKRREALMKERRLHEKRDSAAAARGADKGVGIPDAGQPAKGRRPRIEHRHAVAVPVSEEEKRRASTNPLTAPNRLSPEDAAAAIAKDSVPLEERSPVPPAAHVGSHDGQNDDGSAGHSPPRVCQSEDAQREDASSGGNQTAGDSELDISALSHQRGGGGSGGGGLLHTDVAFDAAELFTPYSDDIRGHRPMKRPSADATYHRQGKVGSPPLGRQHKISASQRRNLVNDGTSKGSGEFGGDGGGANRSSTGSTVSPVEMLSPSDTSLLVTFASHIGRVFLSQLPADAVDVLVNRLYLPNLRRNRDGQFPSSVPKASLRHFGQRIVTMSNAVLCVLLSSARRTIAKPQQHYASSTASKNNGEASTDNEHPGTLASPCRVPPADEGRAPPVAEHLTTSLLGVHISHCLVASHATLSAEMSSEAKLGLSKHAGHSSDPAQPPSVLDASHEGPANVGSPDNDDDEDQPAAPHRRFEVL